jgi:hypothetical protein
MNMKPIKIIKSKTKAGEKVNTFIAEQWECGKRILLYSVVDGIGKVYEFLNQDVNTYHQNEVGFLVMLRDQRILSEGMTKTQIQDGFGQKIAKLAITPDKA